MSAPSKFPLAGFDILADASGQVALTAVWTSETEAAYDVRVASHQGRDYAMMPEEAVTDVLARLDAYLRRHDLIGRAADKANLRHIGQAAMNIVLDMVSKGELRWLDAETRFVYKGSSS